MKFKVTHPRAEPGHRGGTTSGNTAGVKTRRATGTFNDETFRAPIPGCRIVIDGSFRKAERTGAAAERLRDGLEAQGWQELPEFSADGHDGTSFAYKKNTVACFARGVWDGGRMMIRRYCHLIPTSSR